MRGTNLRVELELDFRIDDRDERRISAGCRVEGPRRDRDTPV